MDNKKMSDYEFWLNNQFSAKISDKNWLGVITSLKKLVYEGNLDENMDYKVIYRPHRCKNERYFAFENISYADNSRSGIFTFDSELSLEAVETVGLEIDEKISFIGFIN